MSQTGWRAPPLPPGPAGTGLCPRLYPSTASRHISDGSVHRARHRSRALTQFLSLEIPSSAICQQREVMVMGGRVGHSSLLRQPGTLQLRRGKPGNRLKTFLCLLQENSDLVCGQHPEPKDATKMPGEPCWVHGDTDHHSASLRAAGAVAVHMSS